MKVALAQIAPRFLDRDATLRLIAASVTAAARAGASLVAFGEALLPGYPVWLSDQSHGRCGVDRLISAASRR